MKWGELFWIGLGGMCGALVRSWIVFQWDDRLPWGLLVVNVLGSCLLALVAAFEDQCSPQLIHFSGTGFCGSLTTISAFSLVSVDLWQTKSELLVWHVGLNLLLSLPLVAVVWWAAGGRHRGIGSVEGRRGDA